MKFSPAEYVFCNLLQMFVDTLWSHDYLRKKKDAYEKAAHISVKTCRYHTY